MMVPAQKNWGRQSILTAPDPWVFNLPFLGGPANLQTFPFLCPWAGVKGPENVSKVPSSYGAELL